MSCREVMEDGGGKKEVEGGREGNWRGEYKVIGGGGGGRGLDGKKRRRLSETGGRSSR